MILFHFYHFFLSLSLALTPTWNLWGLLYQNWFIQFSLWIFFLYFIQKRFMTEKLNFLERKGDLLTVSKLIRPIIIDILFDKNQVFISQVYRIPKWYGTHQYQARKKNERTNEREWIKLNIPRGKYLNIIRYTSVHVERERVWGRGR